MVVAMKNAIASHCFAIYNEHVYKAEYQAEDAYNYINSFSFYIQMQIMAAEAFYTHSAEYFSSKLRFHWTLTISQSNHWKNK